MFGPILNPTRGFWGFPAGSLPRLRFMQGVAPKPMIARDFLARGEPEKIFTLSFPARQGKMETALPGRLSAPFGAAAMGRIPRSVPGHASVARGRCSGGNTPINRQAVFEVRSRAAVSQSIKEDCGQA